MVRDRYRAAGRVAAHADKYLASSNLDQTRRAAPRLFLDFHQSTETGRDECYGFGLGGRDSGRRRAWRKGGGLRARRSGEGRRSERRCGSEELGNDSRRTPYTAHDQPSQGAPAGRRPASQRPACAKRDIIGAPPGGFSTRAYPDKAINLAQLRQPCRSPRLGPACPANR